jgi:hypothetical protein
MPLSVYKSEIIINRKIREFFRDPDSSYRDRVTCGELIIIFF